jgi:hypothetical protein
MDMQKQIKTVMAKTQHELDVQKYKCKQMVDFAVGHGTKDNDVLYRVYADIGRTVCKISKLDKMILEQQFHANKVFFIDFISFPIVALLKVIKIFKK